MAALHLTLVLLSFAYFSSAAQQWFTVYSGKNYTGESYTITENTPDLTLLPVVMNRESYCIRGWWLLLSETNFNENNGIGSVWYSAQDDEHCVPSISNYIWHRSKSIRHVGHSDTRQVGLSLYNEEWYYGQEFYVGDEDVAEVPFPIYSYAMTGSSVWTFYTESNFGGFSYCVSSPDDIVRRTYPTGTSSNIKSVRRGCHKATTA